MKPADSLQPPAVFPRSHIAALDGLRGWAIVLVLFTHVVPAWGWAKPLTLVASYGWVGVDLFFVLSGFLITGILIDSKHRPGYLKNFYARRILRIWPIYFLLLAAVFLVTPHFGAAFEFPHSYYRWQYYVFYLQNLWLYDFGPYPLQVTWSLAVEEQFYLLWPLVVLVTPATRLKKILVALAVAAPLLRVGVILGGGRDFALYTHTFCRLDGLVLGSLLATWTRSASFDWKKLRRAGTQALAVALPLTVATAYLGRMVGTHRQALLVYSILLWLLAITFTACLALTLSSAHHPRRFAFIVDNAVLRRLGKISYGFYIYHCLTFLIFRTSSLNRALMQWQHSLLGSVTSVLVQLLFAYAVAELSWRFIESPVLRLKRHFESRPVGGAQDNEQRLQHPLIGSAAAGS